MQSGYDRNDAAIHLNYVLWGIALIAVALLVAQP